MQSSWFCERCKSMNRGSVSVCYKCHRPRSAAAIVARTERTRGVVLTPGLDEGHRRVAWALMARHRYYASWRLGYATSVALLLAMPGMMLLSGTAAVLALDNLGASPLTVRQFALPAYLCVGLSAVVIVFHSLYLGLASADAPALGSGSLEVDPARASLWWVESTLWALRAGLAFLLPPLLLFLAFSAGGALFGIVLGFTWMACSYMLLGDPITALTRPRRLLEELVVRTSVPGSGDARMVSWWSIAWGTAQGVAYAAGAIIYVALTIVIIASFAGPRVGFRSPTVDGAGLAQAARVIAVLLALIRAMADGIALMLLARITAQISSNQRTREKWVAAGAHEGSIERVETAKP
jgi:hypothetical protein